jgi:Na+-transporting NADH:ubiquinone oxidoreductase subunit NqrD
MFKRYDEDGNRKELPDGIKVIILLVVIIGMVIAVDKVTDYVYKQDMIEASVE